MLNENSSNLFLVISRFSITKFAFSEPIRITIREYKSS